MNKVCKDCLHAYGDLYGMSYLCSTCENGSCFTPSVIYTQLTVRQEWPNSVTTRMQAAQMASDIKRMANALEDLVGLYLVNGNPTFFQSLDYIIRVYENDGDDYLYER